ncbi:1-acyl-sn-glycerol-3-phosphate acyltransferase [Mucilaginibacter limnophilus]|uniref:1-acyl-sn-glycerol-3-phosphate acyltransferase n=1 Tax=Mucilaginibacter limnophilus TaxID=1932778 RepID=A0A437MKA7_9SPHI|nr:lysophospholipid acyltransferase family protein [Mucilaginibacter limnophilus]RVT98059.1 1-acyl-sn-glycerol-3-phosphate acyltransferase [Mucilaginibacter limnophilus]
MKLILKKVHTQIYRYSVGLFYFIFWPFLYYYSRNPGRYKSMNKVRRVWGFISSMVAGITYNIDYEQRIDWSKAYIICPNHTSNLDITAMSLAIKNNICFMGKDELLDGVVTRLFFQTVDIPVNRESKMSSFRAFKAASERLQQGMTMVIFPEGTIPDIYPPELIAFKNGPFRMAIEHKIPVIPVTSLNTWQILWDDGKKLGSKPGVCNIFVHKPVETAHLTLDDAEALREQVYNIINQKLQQA